MLPDQQGPYEQFRNDVAEISLAFYYLAEVDWVALVMFEMLTAEQGISLLPSH